MKLKKFFLFICTGIVAAIILVGLSEFPPLKFVFDFVEMKWGRPAVGGIQAGIVAVVVTCVVRVHNK